MWTSRRHPTFASQTPGSGARFVGVADGWGTVAGSGSWGSWGLLEKEEEGPGLWKEKKDGWMGWMEGEVPERSASWYPPRAGRDRARYCYWKFDMLTAELYYSLQSLALPL